LSAPNSEPNEPAQTRGLPDTDPVVPVLTTNQTNTLPVSPAEYAIRPLEEQQLSIPTRQDQFKEQRVIYEEEPSAFTGNLPVVFDQKRDPGRSLFLKEDVENTPEAVEAFIEDIGPFTGNLPAISGQIVESQRQSAQPQTIRPTQKLWAYVNNRSQESGETASIILSHHSK
ncbi:MAG TPA: hypothetical protein VHV10_11510, partial [Ktedonobacteraceae bacterium]|nr:hypothetical protein [Ktedonobacteraceae bacterium]